MRKGQKRRYVGAHNASIPKGIESSADPSYAESAIDKLSGRKKFDRIRYKGDDVVAGKLLKSVKHPKNF